MQTGLGVGGEIHNSPGSQHRLQNIHNAQEGSALAEALSPGNEQQREAAETQWPW